MKMFCTCPTLGASLAHYHFMDKRSRYGETKSNSKRDDLKDKIYNKKCAFPTVLLSFQPSNIFDLETPSEFDVGRRQVVAEAAKTVGLTVQRQCKVT